MRTLENRIPPPILFMLTALAMWAATRHATPLIEPGPVSMALTGLCLALGLLMGAPAIRAFRAARTTINPVDIEQASTLVTGGVFRFSRNPMYVSLTALLLAWAIQLGASWALLGPGLFALFIHRFQILPEERVLAAKFGAGFGAYRQAVRRWL